MALRKAAFILMIFWLVGPSWGAVVPDGDKLPRDSGAPALPGGHRDPTVLAKPEKSPGLNLRTPHLPDGPAGQLDGTLTGSSPSGGSGKDSSAKSAGTRPPFPQGSADPVPGGNPSLGQEKEKPPASLFLLGGLIVVFIVWAGWRTRRGEGED
jgi:hypothetical protein